MCAQALIDHGATVVISARKAEPARLATQALQRHGSCEFVEVDLAAPGGVDVLAEAMRSRFKTLDIVVNNAGVTWGAPLEAYPASAWARVLQLDVAVPFQLSVALLPLLRSGAARRPPARIVNIGSIDGHAVGPFDNYAYQVAKAGVHQLTRMLAHRLGQEQITVNCIAPGPIRTDMTARVLEEDGASMAATVPLRRIAEPDDIAGALVYLTSRAGAFVTGAVVPVDGGASIATWGPERD
jgi:NAD(P)-dependent dehydrogenase (short-subunit alcohol dehydrogenase family)